MSPITVNLRRRMAYLALCLLSALAIASALVQAALTPWHAALAFALPMAVSLGFVAASAYYVCRSVVLTQRSGVQTVAMYGGASLMAGLFWVLACLGWNVLGASILSSAAGEAWASDPLTSGQLLPLPPGLLLFLGLLAGAVYLISLLAHDIWLAADQLRAAQAREARSHLLAREAQLQMLRTQINPHFLFNSLNSISALTAQNAAAARAMTLELAAFFRQTLALSEKERIPLAEEIALCEHFLAVEKIRFGDQLSSAIEVSEAARSVMIPPLLLQPCVENAVKHGVRHIAEGGCVTLRAMVQQDWLYVTIENPVDADAPSSAGTGTGLLNIQQRLVAMYGERARLKWTHSSERFTMELVLPTPLAS